METIQLLLSLPESTARCEIGPVLQQKPGTIDIWYDIEGEKDLLWTHIGFEFVLAMRFTPEVAVTESMVQAYSKIFTVLKSSWLEEIKTIASEKHQNIIVGLRHMMVFFDHYGCIEVISKNVSINEKNPPIDITK